MELIIATIGLLFVFTYMMTKSETWVFKLLLLGLIIAGISTLGGVAFDHTNCDTEFTYNNTTGDPESLERLCTDDPSDGSDTFMIWTSWIVRILMIYIVGLLLYQMLDALNKLPKMLKRKRRANQIRRTGR